MAGANRPYVYGGDVNYLQLCQRLNQEAGLQGAETRPASVLNQTGMMARVVKWIAESWVDIQSQRDWDFMRTTLTFNTIVGQRDYTSVDIPAYATVRRLDNFAQVTDATPTIQPIYPLSYIEFRKRFERQAAASARPQYFTAVNGGIIRFDSTPDAIYPVRMDAFMTPTVLANTTDTPAIPDADHMIIVWAALMKYAFQDSQTELYQYAQLNYERMLSALLGTQVETASRGVEPLA